MGASYFMNSDIGFQVICANCGCLSIKIEEPLKSAREAVVYCGDCGASRGTVGALRDLAVQRHPAVMFPTSPFLLSAVEHTADEPILTTKISTQYAELQRLREQVKIAEWLASETSKSDATNRLRKTNARNFAFRSSSSQKRNRYFADERDKRPD
jgi:hypothetical protein